MRMTLLLCALTGCTGAEVGEKSHTQEILEFQRRRLESLHSDTGWLTVAGFSWLTPGENSFGSGSHCAVPMPEGAPEQAGVFILSEDGVRVTLADGVQGTIDEAPAAPGQFMAPDVTGSPNFLQVGRFTLWVIERGGRLGVRLRDPEAPLRREFAGLESYPIDEAYRLDAEYVPLEQPAVKTEGNVLGYETEYAVYGRVHFTLEGKEFTLSPTQDDSQDSTLFIVFADKTTGTETYGGGRFLYADVAEDGTVVLDFNKAYNPPCAFNPYTTCPLPAPENLLPIAIRAGEMAYKGAGS